LTSPGALNPLPARPPVSLSDQDQIDQSRPFDTGSYDRPKKTLSDDVPPSRFQPEVKQEPLETSSMLNGIKEEPGPSRIERDRPASQSYNMAIEPTARPPSSPAPKTLDLPDSEPNGTSRPKDVKSKTWAQMAGKGTLRKSDDTVEHKPESETQQDDESGGSQLLTAIYRPESKAAWREELRAANEKAEKVRLSMKWAD